MSKYDFIAIYGLLLVGLEYQAGLYTKEQFQQLLLNMHKQYDQLVKPLNIDQIQQCKLKEEV